MCRLLQAHAQPRQRYADTGSRCPAAHPGLYRLAQPMHGSDQAVPEIGRSQQADDMLHWQACNRAGPHARLQQAPYAGKACGRQRARLSRGCLLYQAHNRWDALRVQ